MPWIDQIPRRFALLGMTSAAFPGHDFALVPKPYILLFSLAFLCVPLCPLRCKIRVHKGPDPDSSPAPRRGFGMTSAAFSSHESALVPKPYILLFSLAFLCAPPRPTLSLLSGYFVCGARSWFIRNQVQIPRRFALLGMTSNGPESSFRPCPVIPNPRFLRMRDLGLALDRSDSSSLRAPRNDKHCFPESRVCPCT